MTRTSIPDPARSGAYRTPADLAALRDALREAHGQWIELDLAAIRSKADVLETIARAASLPSHFGRNWDALADCLQDLPAASSAFALHLRNTAAARAALAEEWEVLLEIMADAAMYWKERTKTFLVFVDGPADLPPWP